MTKESDEIKIEHEQDYREIAKTISRKKRPAKILRKLMNMMEAYRQSKKYGWSRPWNKHNLTNFQSFKLDHRNDELLYLNSQRFLSEMFSGAPEEVRVFSEGLLSDTNELMSFLFCHEYSDGNKHFEGATLSFGRINNKRYRDRIDIILEAEVINGVSQGYSRSRVFVDPYRNDVREPLWEDISNAIAGSTGETLFKLLSMASWDWADIPERHWDHWTSSYIDYFGDRQWNMEKSCFWIEANPVARMELMHKAA